jgi:hypothetical protein
LAEAFERYRKTDEWAKKAPRTREEWERCWRLIEPIFGETPPRRITLEHISQFRSGVARDVSEREAHRCIKVWRALWRVAAAMGYCDREADPALGVRNTEPQPRQAVWREGEVVRLAKTAWRMGYRGLAAVIAAAWDTQLSPVDIRQLTASQRIQDALGVAFLLSRAKTGRAAAGTLSRRSDAMITAYIKSLPFEPHDRSPIFRNRSGAPYSKDTLGDDFRDIRAAVFGPAENRTLADLRRSGAVEAIKGGASAAGLSAKMANDLSSSNSLHKTYVPVDLATVRSVDAARRRGRHKN